MAILSFSSIRNRISRIMLLLVGVLVVSAAFGIFLSISETAVVQVNENLAKYWRTAYDILVRPPGSRSEVEKSYNLVQPNFLLGIPGGITFDQYEAIRNIPGIEVVAPVAVIGALPESLAIVITNSLPSGVFSILCTLNEDNGVSILQRTYGPNFQYVGADANIMSEKERSLIFPSNTADCHIIISGLMVGVDPEAEETLVGLRQAILEGDYLRKGPISPFLTDEIQPGRKFPGLSQTGAYSIPVLVNVTPYISFTVSAKVVRLELPPEVKGIRDIFEKGGPDFLATLPYQEVVAQKIIEREEAYQWLTQQITNRVLTLSFNPFTGKTTMFPVQISLPQYHLLSVSPIPESSPVLEAIFVEGGFREQQSRLLHPFGYFVVGTFSVERLGLPEELAAVPLETYFPSKGVLRFDENGFPIEPKILWPTTDPRSYFIPPPLFLTTIEAARAIAGDDCISAIRVRVAGVDRFSPEAQSKLEAVAAEIINRTGLDVDIVVGSSPRPILVHIPGIGYVEEYWVQKGVALTTHREVQKANILLFAAMLLVCALFIFNTASTTVAGRIPEFGLLKALGWRGSSLAGLVLKEGLLIGAVGGTAGTALALGVAEALGLVFPLGRAALILPTAVLLCLAGFALPALRAARVAPVVALGQGEQTGVGRLPQWLGYVGRSLLRRRMRAVLTAGVMAAGAGMLSFLVSLLVGMRGYLALTLLGQYILVRVSGVHWGMVGVMLGVGALATADVLLVGILERRREIGVLKALGWRTGAVAQLFLLEGAVLGLLGGVVGTALGLGVYLALYRSVGAGLLGALAAGLGVPAAVGVLAAAYPARVAARVPPAEAVRGE